MKGILFPHFTVEKTGLISVNFGKESFVYDIANHDRAAEKSGAAVAAKIIE